MGTRGGVPYHIAEIVFMADQQGVWGIEIGQAGLKAIRLRYAEAASQALAVAFDYIPHPKILSQPDAIPEELIGQALDKFLQRNQVKGDLLAISVPGNTSLIKFIKLPPVESSKVAEIVKYEARQQIPFALEDVIWDYQPLGGGADDDTGFVLDAEVGLFAMKRDQVMQNLKPFTDRKLEIEVIQSAPLAVFNMIVYDQMEIRNDSEQNFGDEYSIIVDMGADNTTMLVSNGGKIWVRNIPIGGNHFTRALSKEMKLTFAKAEHLKCNATKSPDPRAVFQALRPVFNDFVAEIQRSIGYFSSVNRDARIVRVIGVGNGFKMAGLQKFLEQNLQYEVVKLERFKGLVGDSVLSDPLFEENILTFAVPYGLGLQALKQSTLKTSLLPPEIATARIIRRKKPWAMAAAATLLFAFGASAFGYANRESSFSEDLFGSQESFAESVKTKKDGFERDYDGEVGKLTGTRDKEDQLVEPAKTRQYWLEIFSAIDACLPRDTGDAKILNEDIQKQNRIKIKSITNEWSADLSEWYSGLDAASMKSGALHMAPADKETGPEGEGYIFTISGYHYHNHEDFNQQERTVFYVVNNFLKKLQSPSVTLPRGKEVPVGLIGISHAALVWRKESVKEYDPEGHRKQLAQKNLARGRSVAGGNLYSGGAGTDEYTGSTTGEFSPMDYAGDAGGAPLPGRLGGAYPGAGPGQGVLPGNVPDEESDTAKDITQFDFVIQFVWKATPPAERTAESPEGDAGAPVE